MKQIDATAKCDHKRISSRLREQAAVLASIGACADSWLSIVDIARVADLPRTFTEASMLMLWAWAHAFERRGTWDQNDRRVYAEAEALLRTGWSP